MRLCIAAVLTTAIAAIASPIWAEDGLAAYKWVNRPVIIFADSPRDPRFVEQVADVEQRIAELEERDVVILIDTDPDAQGPLRKKLRPRGFQLILIGKDGEIKLRTPHPMEIDALNRHIDRMPMRKREMRGGQD